MNKSRFIRVGGFFAVSTVIVLSSILTVSKCLWNGHRIPERSESAQTKGYSAPAGPSKEDSPPPSKPEIDISSVDALLSRVRMPLIESNGYFIFEQVASDATQKDSHLSAVLGEHNATVGRIRRLTASGESKWEWPGLFPKRIEIELDRDRKLASVSIDGYIGTITESAINFQRELGPQFVDKANLLFFSMYSPDDFNDVRTIGKGVYGEKYRELMERCNVSELTVISGQDRRLVFAASGGSQRLVQVEDLNEQGVPKIISTVIDWTTLEDGVEIPVHVTHECNRDAFQVNESGLLAVPKSFEMRIAPDSLQVAFAKD